MAERAGVSSPTEADGAYSTNMNSSFYMHKRYMVLTKYITDKIYIFGLQGVTIKKYIYYGLVYSFMERRA